MKKSNLGSFLVVSTAMPTACSMLYSHYITRKLKSEKQMSEEERRVLKDRLAVSRAITRVGTAGLVVSTTLQQLGMIGISEVNIENKLRSNFIEYKNSMKDLKYELNSDIIDGYENVDEWFGGSYDEE